MGREVLTRGHEIELLRVAADSYNLKINHISVVDCCTGNVNLIYECQHQGQLSILRISFRLDRTRDLIGAELHFVDYLAAHDTGVSVPFVSKNDNYVETVMVNDQPIHMVCFEKAKEVPDNDIEDFSQETALDEQYYRNWGAAMGQMHALYKYYQPISDVETRTDRIGPQSESLDIDKLIPSEMKLLTEKVHVLLDKISSLPKDRESYGMIHGDLTGENFTVNPLNDEITIFDFDDSCYFYFVFVLALVWEEVVNRTDDHNVEDRGEFVKQYFQAFLDSYSQENKLPDEWFLYIPLFISSIQESKERLDCLKSEFDAVSGPSDHTSHLNECDEEDLSYVNIF